MTHLEKCCESRRTRLAGARLRCWLSLATALAVAAANAATQFTEAEALELTGGAWQVRRDPFASGLQVLGGRGDPAAAVATTSLELTETDTYRVWVRFQQGTERAPFRLTLTQKEQVIAEKQFDLAPTTAPVQREDAEDALAEPAVLGQPVVVARGEGNYVWDALECRLAAGVVRLALDKPRQLPCSIDCLLLTTDLALVPDHRDYGPQTYLRISLADVYERPVYVWLFADHYRAPWWGGGVLTRAGVEHGPSPFPSRADLYFAGGEQSPWVRVTPMLYADSGARFEITVKYTHWEEAPRQKFRLDVATAPADEAIVRAIDRDCTGGGMHLVMPPDLATPEHRRRLETDLDIATRIGELADATSWPSFGRYPTRFPFHVIVGTGGTSTGICGEVAEREGKTLRYFGYTNAEDNPFSPDRRRVRPSVRTWREAGGCRCQYDLVAIKAAAEQLAQWSRQDGIDPTSIPYLMLADEPEASPEAHLPQCQLCTEKFRQWLRDELRLEPAQLVEPAMDELEPSWDAVHPVARDQRDAHPELFYYSNKFRVIAFSRFVRVQREALRDAFGAEIPVNVNFSDGATYWGNFYPMGVDYFAWLRSDDQNAMWSEDWANAATTQQCAAYNIDLMRCAARRRGQHLGHYLIAHARTAWDAKLKAVSGLARGIKLYSAYFYGPEYISHEGGVGGRGTIHTQPWLWSAQAELLREVGGAEDLLLAATVPAAKTAILYASTTDIWQHARDHGYGFDRMHTWLALAHAQTPVDFLAEDDVAAGALNGYEVCYLSGPNLLRACAGPLQEWVRNGGTLALTAGAASLDEFNRPLDLLDQLLPADRQPVIGQGFLGPPYSLGTLPAMAVATMGDTSIEVLGAKQSLRPRAGAETLAQFADGSAAIVRGRAAKGTVYCIGFLPGLPYIKAALAARASVLEQSRLATATDTAAPAPQPPSFRGSLPPAELPRRSGCPWEFSAALREVVLLPVRSAKVQPPLTCSVPLVDAVYMTAPTGALVALANYTLQPLAEVRFTVRVGRPVRSIESVHYGRLEFARDAAAIAFSLPLETTDFVKIMFE